MAKKKTPKPYDGYFDAATKNFHAQMIGVGRQAIALMRVIDDHDDPLRMRAFRRQLCHWLMCLMPDVKSITLTSVDEDGNERDTLVKRTKMLKEMGFNENNR